MESRPRGEACARQTNLEWLPMGRSVDENDSPPHQPDSVGLECSCDHQDHVIGSVCHHGGDEAIVEHQPEEHHPEEPRVHEAEQTEVCVTASEVSVGTDDGRTDCPRHGVELGLEQTKGQPVGDRQEQVHVEPVHQAEGDPVEEH